MRIFVLLVLLFSQNVYSQMQAVEIYGHAQLIKLIRTGNDLKQLTQDDCQLSRDIEARAKVLKEPMFQYLWARMQLHGVCTAKLVATAMLDMQASAEQGLPEAMLKLAQYYRHSDYVMADTAKSRNYIKMAAEAGSLQAQLLWADWALTDKSKLWQQDLLAIHQLLKHRIFKNRQQKQQVVTVLAQLEQRIPATYLR